MSVKRSTKSPESFLAAAAIYQTLFNRMTIPINDDTMLFDEFTNDLDFLKSDAEDYERMPYENLRKKYGFKEKYNIIATFEIIFMIGWKYHESQQQAENPKSSREISLREVLEEIEIKEGKGAVRYGTLSEDMKEDEITQMVKTIKK